MHYTSLYSILRHLDFVKNPAAETTGCYNYQYGFLTFSISHCLNGIRDKRFLKDFPDPTKFNTLPDVDNTPVGNQGKGLNLHLGFRFLV